MFTSQQAFAHPDLPSDGDLYHISVVLKDIEFGDGADSEWEDVTSGADLVIGWRVEYIGHGVSAANTVVRDNYNIIDGRHLTLDTPVLEHDECTPLSSLRIYTWGAESEQKNILTTDRAMKQLIQHPNLSTGHTEAQQRFESAGDEFIGHQSRLVDLEDGYRVGSSGSADRSVPIDDAGLIRVFFETTITRISDDGVCNPSVQPPQNHTSKTVPAKKSHVADSIKQDKKMVATQNSKLESKPNKKMESAELTQLKTQLRTLYQVSKFDEKITSIIKKANDDEAKTLKKLSGDTKSIYSKSKNPEIKKLGDKIQAQIKDAEQDKKEISAIDSGSKKITKQILDIAKDNKITKSELDKPIKNSKNDLTNQKPANKSDQQLDHGSIYIPSSLLTYDPDELAKILFNAPTEREKRDQKYVRSQLESLEKELDDKLQQKNTKPQDPNAPPESILDDVELSGPDAAAPKDKSKEQKSDSNAKSQNPNAPPESILDDIEINGPDAKAPKEKQDETKFPLDWQRIAEEDMKITEKALAQKLQDQVKDRKLLLDFNDGVSKLIELQLKDSKKVLIDREPIQIPDIPPNKKSIIQKEPVITEPKPSNTKPTLSIPKQVTQEATGPSGANVVFSTSSQDKEDGSLTPKCSPQSGTTFPIGTTTVSCIVTDSQNNSVSGSFTVTIRDTTPPAFGTFQPTEGVKDDTGVQVFFDVTATDLVDGNVPVSCNYQSGYKFPIGVTDLKCTASDSKGNQSTKTIQITVTAKESGQ